MRTNGYFRSKERTKRLKKINNQHCYFVEHKHWDDPKSFLKRSYLSGRRKTAKLGTNHIIRHMENVPNYAGYRKSFDYWWELF